MSGEKTVEGSTAVYLGIGSPRKGKIELLGDDRVRLLCFSDPDNDFVLTTLDDPDLILLPPIGRRAGYEINGTVYAGEIGYYDPNPDRDYVRVDFDANVVPSPMNNFVYATIGDPRLHLNVPEVSQSSPSDQLSSH